MLRMTLATAALTLLLVSAASAQTLEPVKSVEIGANAELRVNGKPFFPLIVWLQEPNDFPLLKELGHNTVAGFWWSAKEGGDANQAGKDPGLADYAAKAWKAGLYFVPSFHADYPAGVAQKVAAMDGTLGWIQGDEPDMPKVVSDAQVTPAKNMNVNTATPFSRVLDGDLSSWTVVQPVTGGEFTIQLKEPVTVGALAIALTTGNKLAVAKEAVFLGDGKELLKAALENKAGRQKFDLKEAATFKALTVRFTDEYPGDNKWGSVGEVEAFDKDGKNVLFSKPRKEPRTSPEDIQAAYAATKAIDKVHPVFMNLTGSFLASVKDYDQATKDRIYPAFAKGCDVLGFDVYPVYGSAMFGHLLVPGSGITELRAFAGPKKPLYSWIETNKGSQWISPDKQPDVKPEHTRFETWAAVIRGAAGIAYFTHKWKDPDGKDNYMQFAPKADPAMSAELKRLNGQITRLSAAILSGPAPVKKVIMTLAGEAGELPCHFKATVLDGALYIFAQNTDLGPDPEKLKQFEPIKPRAGKATFTVAPLKKDTKIEVVDENRTITSGDQGFTDDFGPLAEHIYKIATDAK